MVMSILELLQRQPNPGFGAPNFGVLGALNFPQAPQAPQPAQYYAPAWQATPAPAAPPPSSGPLSRLFAERGAAPAQSSPAPASPASPARQPQPRRAGPATSGPNLTQVLPLDTSAPALAPTNADRAPRFMERLAGFSDAMNAPVSEGNAMTPMDLLSLGAQLMGAGEASWNVNQPAGWERAGRALAETGAAADDRAWRNEQREQWRADNERDAWRYGREQTAATREDEEAAALDAAIATLPEGPERQWALANREEFARIALGRQARAGTEEIADGFRWRVGADGRTLERVDEVPLNAAQRAEIEIQRARIAADGAGGGVRPLTGGQYQVARQRLSAVDRTRSQLGRVEAMLGRMTDAQLASQMGQANSGFLSALTDLQMALKDQSELGALAGPDLALLRSFTGDPRDTIAFLRGGGAGGMRQALAEVDRSIGLSEQGWRTEFMPWSERAELADLYERFNTSGESEAAAQPQQAPSAAAIRALLQHRDDPRAVAAFVEDFGRDALEQALAGQGQQQRSYRPAASAAPGQFAPGWR